MQDGPSIGPSSKAASRRSVLIRSVLVGSLATAVDLALLGVLVEVFQLTSAAANLPALLAGALVQFLGTKFFAFEDRSPALLRQGTLFGVVEVAALALNALGFYVATRADWLPYGVARVMVQAVVYFGFSLPLWRRIFAAPAMPAGASS